MQQELDLIPKSSQIEHATREAEPNKKSGKGYGRKPPSPSSLTRSYSNRTSCLPLEICILYVALFVILLLVLHQPFPTSAHVLHSRLTSLPEFAQHFPRKLGQTYAQHLPQVVRPKCQLNPKPPPLDTSPSVKWIIEVVSIIILLLVSAGGVYRIGIYFYKHYFKHLGKEGKRVLCYGILIFLVITIGVPLINISGMLTPFCSAIGTVVLSVVTKLLQTEKVKESLKKTPTVGRELHIQTEELKKVIEVELALRMIGSLNNGGGGLEYLKKERRIQIEELKKTESVLELRIQIEELEEPLLNSVRAVEGDLETNAKDGSPTEVQTPPQAIIQ